MNKKKTLGVVLAMALVAVISVVGTLAYLQKTTGPVTNTFSASGLLTDDSKFVIKEHKVAILEADKGTGVYSYVKGDGTAATAETDKVEVDGNNYTDIVPGKNLPKDPFVRIGANQLKTDAYLFIESVEKLPAGLTWTYDNSNWTELTNVTPNVNAASGETVKVYAYRTKLEAGNTADIVVNIISGKTINVASNYIGGTGEHLDFHAYLTQAEGFTDAEAAWKATYGATTP